MTDFFFISYSSVDGREFARKLANELAGGVPAVPVWLDAGRLRPGEDWDEQIVEAIRTCKGVVFAMSPDSVRPDSVCKNEWTRALKYKKPILPLLVDRDAEMPFGLGSREYIDFTGSFDAAVARLRKHLDWMDSPEGQLQAVKHRLSDAQRELPRAEPERRARILEDIAELQKQVAQQQKVIDQPEREGEKVQKSIDAGLEIERQPVHPVSGLPQGKFINPPPLIAPTWFQNRHFETGQIGLFLKDESLRLMTVVGRGGVGKTAMVCRLLRSLESGRLPDDGGPLAVNGIVYLSAARSFHRPNVPDMYAGLTKLLPNETVEQLNSIYRNPQTTTRATVEALAQAFPAGRTVILLDNFEDVLDVETGLCKDPELDEALRALLEAPPHGLKLLITTRVAPLGLARVQPGLQRRLDLDEGLQSPYAENILRAMDADGKLLLRDAPDALLAEARARTRGYPRALEHLFGILSADRDTSLPEILENTSNFLPEQVVVVLVGEAFSRLDQTAQRVMQALAIYHYPVPPAAVDYLLQPYVPGIESSRVLSRLVNMQFARRDAGRYYLHQTDRDYALSRIPLGTPDDRDAETPPLTCHALRHRAAEWFKLSRKPRESWKSLNDLAAQLSEFELRCEGDDYDTAVAALLDFDYDCLFLWGHYRLMIDLHERLQGSITDGKLARDSIGNLGSAYYRTGQVQRAINLYERALQLTQEDNDKIDEGVWLGNLAATVSDLGENTRAAEYLERALAINRNVGNRKSEGDGLGLLGVLCSEIGQERRAIEYYEEALKICRELENVEGEALTLNNLGESYRRLGRLDDARRIHAEALGSARSIGYRLIEAESSHKLALIDVLGENWSEAARGAEQAIDIADEIGHIPLARDARETLALVHLRQNKLAAARAVIEDAASHDVLLANYLTSAMLGLVALRQRDLSTARNAFRAAVRDAGRLLDLTPDRYPALDAQGLSFCGLALCGEPERIPAATAAYRAARAITSEPGTVREVVQRFDILAREDAAGILTEIRRVAAGIDRGASAAS